MGFICSWGVSLVGAFTLSLGSSGMWPLWKRDCSDGQEKLCQELSKAALRQNLQHYSTVLLFKVWVSVSSLNFTKSPLFGLVAQTDFPPKLCLSYLLSSLVCALTSSSLSTSQVFCGCSQAGCFCLRVHSCADFYPQLFLCICQSHICRVALRKKKKKSNKPQMFRFILNIKTFSA